MASNRFEAVALGDMPMFAPGMDVAGEVARAARAAGLAVAGGDVVVVAQKIVSKAEGRGLELGAIAVGQEARALAGRTGRDGALAQAILDESLEVLRASPAAIIVRHRTGHVLANAGIDASNVAGGADGAVLLWPRDPDASARAIRDGLERELGVRPAVVIADSLGRAWRLGTLGTAIGVAGLAVIDDRRGGRDLYGRELQATVVAVADAIAAIAVLAMGEGAEATPACLVRGAAAWVDDEDGPGAASGLRAVHEDMFR